MPNFHPVHDTAANRNYYQINQYRKYYTANLAEKLSFMPEGSAKALTRLAFDYYMRGNFIEGLISIDKAICSIRYESNKYLPNLLNLKACIILGTIATTSDDITYDLNNALCAINSAITISSDHKIGLATPYEFYLNKVRVLRNLKQSFESTVDEAEPLLPPSLNRTSFVKLCQHDFDIFPKYPIDCKPCDSSYSDNTDTSKQKVVRFKF